MKKLLTAAAGVFLLSVPVLPQDGGAGGLKDGVFSEATIGFRYTPPAGLKDETSFARDALKEKAATLRTSNTLDVLLLVTSGPDDTDPEWHAVSIESYSRSRIAGDDAAAETKMNLWTAGAGVTLTRSPDSLSIAGHNFVVSNFELSEPPLLKQARVYTTIRNGNLIAFAFTANSVDKIARLADSLKTLEFAAENHGSSLGFDRNEYPGDANLKDLRATFSYSGYWLNNPPGTTSNTWVGTRDRLEAAGFGFAVLFNGRPYRELGNEGRASQLGQSDAQIATQAAGRDGFPAQTIIFLDQEEGGRLYPQQKAYLFAWIDGVRKAGFRAGVYCSGTAAREKGGERVVTAEYIRKNAGGREITFWVTNDMCPPAPGCTVPGRSLPPSASGVSFADVWQFAQSPRREKVAAGCGVNYPADGKCYAPGSGSGSGQELAVDLDAATSADPSHGRTR